jgi:hypothetical protein
LFAEKYEQDGKKSPNRKQFVSFGTKAANFEIDHEILFFLRLDFSDIHISSNEINKSSRNKFYWEMQKKTKIYRHVIKRLLKSTGLSLCYIIFYSIGCEFFSYDLKSTNIVL